MDAPLRFCIGFSGITIRFLLPGPAVLPEALSAFLCDDPGQVDGEYQVCLLRQPLNLTGLPVHTEAGTALYRTSQGWLRVYTPRTEPNGCQVACLMCPDGKNKLFYPAERWDFYSSPLHCIHLIGIEALLLKRNAFLLHSSVVMLNSRTVLFSGPSGAGKSTQAALWAEHLGARILNGDRCVIMERDGCFLGGGSPWSGTSRIYRREQAPIAGIFLVHQAPENRVLRLGREAFAPLFGQTIVNSWDPDFMGQITRLFAKLLEQVPVYRLECRADSQAARMAYQTLF